MTTIVTVRRGKDVVIAGDGQVTMGQQAVMKRTARKVRKIHNGKVLCGFAGSAADALILYDILEEKLNEYSGGLVPAAVAFAKHWCSDTVFRKLDALLICADRERTFIIGSGDVIEPEEGIAAIGSGGNYALAAARALYRNTDFSAEKICTESLRIAAEICVFTNDHVSLEKLE